MSGTEAAIDAVDTAIEDRGDDSVKFLEELVAAETVTGSEALGQEVVIDPFESLGLTLGAERSILDVI
jgi:hypothetical protein